MASIRMRKFDTDKLSARFRRMARELPPVVIVGMTLAANDAKADLEATVATWRDQPTFDIDVETKRYTITTDDPIWNMLNRGTRPHGIDGFLSFLNQYTAKTTPGQLSSQSGGASGDRVFATHVDHPGTKARKWDAAIAKKYQPKLAKYVRDELKKGVEAIGL